MRTLAEKLSKVGNTVTLEDLILNRGGRTDSRYAVHCPLPPEKPISQMPTIPFHHKRRPDSKRR